MDLSSFFLRFYDFFLKKIEKIEAVVFQLGCLYLNNDKNIEYLIL